jgi:enamine deaminase RidA (YjgF/YER057c/UK114 family)
MLEPNRRAVLSVGFAASVLAMSRRALAQTGGAGSPEQRLRERGIALPPVPAPVANYVPYTRMGNLVFLAGTGGRRQGLPTPRGRVGADVSVEEAYQHARLAGLSLLAAMREAAGGSLDNVARVGKVVGWVNAVPEFTEQAKVIDGCTDLFVEVFGDRGRPARSVFGASTAFGVTVIVEAVAEVA